MLARICKRADAKISKANPALGIKPLSCQFVVERVTRIELALSAWEDDVTGHVMPADLLVRLSVSDRDWPLFTVVNGLLMARPSTAL